MKPAHLADIDMKWDAYCMAAEKAHVSPPQDSMLVNTLKRVFSFSDFVAQSAIRHPEMLSDLIASGDLRNPYPAERYTTRVTETLSGIETAPDRHAAGLKVENLENRIQRALRKRRQREMLRIAFRDLSGWADLSETMADLTAFADACLKQTLSILYIHQCQEYGAPRGRDGSIQFPVIFGMGKLGAKELNFSSDVDLIFGYPDSGKTDGGPTTITNEAFFVRLCRKLLNVISASTAEGIVFRIDPGLRPFGESGPIVMSFDAMEDYYQRQGRDWERYAWIKARVVADECGAGDAFLGKLTPFIYRRYLDFATFESLRDMKKKIAFEIKQKGMSDDIKLGPGGIREIEFFGQIFQLLRGGLVPALRERRIEKVLRVLVREDYIDEKVCDELSGAYRFLRKTEHRLQEYADQQTHTLPSDNTGRKRLATAMGFREWGSFYSQLTKHMARVHAHFTFLLETKDSTGPDSEKEKKANKLVAIGLDPIGDEQTEKMLSDAGFDEPAEVIRLLNHLRNAPATRALSVNGRRRLDRLIPLILKEVVSSEQPVLALNRIIELIKTIERRTSYLALLLENPSVLTHLVKFADSSSWIVTFLSHHPLLFDELLDPRTLYRPPEKSDLERELLHRLEPIPSSDLEYQMEELRIFKQINMLRVAASDITGVLPLMKVSDHLTDIAEAVIREVLALSWRHLIQKHGKPACRLDGKKCDLGFAVIAYGKLGGIELGYGSDLDLIFIHAGEEGVTTQGAQPIDHAQFFSRLGQRVIHMLTAHTATGILYKTDMRLRPNGRSGLLVSHIDAFEAYQTKSAWTWEHQAIIKARPIAGDIRLAARFNKIREKVLVCHREEKRLQKQIAKMREQMRQALWHPEPGIFDLKQDSGGIVDIEFLVQYLILLKSNEHHRLIKWTDNVRLIQSLLETDVIDRQTAHILRHAYLVYRSLIHRLSLQEKPAKISEKRFLDLRKKVMEISHFFIED